MCYITRTASCGLEFCEIYCVFYAACETEPMTRKTSHKGVRKRPTLVEFYYSLMITNFGLGSIYVDVCIHCLYLCVCIVYNAQCPGFLFFCYGYIHLVISLSPKVQFAFCCVFLTGNFTLEWHFIGLIRRPQSPVTWLFVQQFGQKYINEINNGPHHWRSSVRGIQRWPVDFSLERPVMPKAFFRHDVIIIRFAWVKRRVRWRYLGKLSIGIHWEL